MAAKSKSQKARSEKVDLPHSIEERIQRRAYGLMVYETPFEFLPLHVVVDIIPIAPERLVVPPSGGLNTRTSTVPGCAMSAAVIAATN